VTSDTLKFYNDNASELCQRYESAEVNHLWEKIVATFHSGSKILEIGCGSGRDASHMYENGLDIIAIDGSLELLNQTIKTHADLSGRVCQTILPSFLPFADAVFDGIISIACLMHFSEEHIRQILSEFCRVTKSNAQFIISIPAGRADVSDGTDDKGRIFILLTIEEWEKLFLDFNIKIIDLQIQSDGLGRKGVEWASFMLKMT